MKHKHNDLNGLSPVKQYNSPQIPTLADKPKLVKLPSRWQKNAAVVACIGIVGGMTLASCATTPHDDNWFHNGGGPIAPYYVTRPTEQETTITGEAIEETTTEVHTTTAMTTTLQAVTTQETTLAATDHSEFDLRVHFGGSGAGPQYVVHFTEQEAFGIIRTQLEAAGLNFGTTPPSHTVEVTWVDPLGHGNTRMTTGLDLYDAERGVAIALSERGGWFAEQTQQRFERDRQTRNLNVHVFYNPGESMDNQWWEGETEPPTPTQKAAAAPALRENLTVQVQTFIEFLQAEGIL